MAAANSFFAWRRVIHSGIRCLKLRLVSSSERPAHSRKRAPKKPDPSSDWRRSASKLAGVTRLSSNSGATSSSSFTCRATALLSA